MKKIKLGIYGGTFNPPHNGHIYAAEKFIETCALDKLLIMPALIPPHKQVNDDSPFARLEMTRLAFSNSPYYPERLEVSDYEITNKQISYTYKTLEHFANNETELYFLCGTDMFVSLGTWKNPARIFELATIVLARRENDMSDTVRIREAIKSFNTLYQPRIIEINYTPIPISSTEVREAVAKFQSLTGMVPDNVAGYIRQHELYKHGHVLEKLIGEYLDDYRVKHTLSVANECKKLAKIYKLTDYDTHRLYIAGLLHDITKCKKFDEQVALADELRIRLTEDDLNSPKILHQFTGAEFARREFAKYCDEDIKTAISCHTTGRRFMTLMDKLLFLADYIEPLRTFDDCVYIRNLFYNGFSSDPDLKHLNEVVLTALKITKKQLESEGQSVHPLTLAAIDALSATES